MGNRSAVKKITSSFGPQRGRPANADDKLIRTKAWYYYVQMSLGEVNASATARRIVNERRQGADERVWHRYKKGTKSVGMELLNHVEQIVPGSRDFFELGPCGLWHSLWGPVTLRWDRTAVDNLMRIDLADIDSEWLVRCIWFWRMRAELATLGYEDEMEDGFYEAVRLALSQPAVSTMLSSFGIMSDILDVIGTMEETYLNMDPTKLTCIRFIGAAAGIRDPIKMYIDDPIRFLKLSYGKDGGFLTKQISPVAAA